MDFSLRKMRRKREKWVSRKKGLEVRAECKKTGKILQRKEGCKYIK